MRSPGSMRAVGIMTSATGRSTRPIFAALASRVHNCWTPAPNLRAGAQILGHCYARAVQQIGEGQAALQRALSCYNTGNQRKGFANGYVKRVVAQVKLKIPALLDGPIDPNASSARSGSTSSRNDSAPAQPTPVVAPLTQQQKRSASHPRAPFGEQGAAAQIEAGAFAHPELGAYIRSASTRGDP